MTTKAVSSLKHARNSGTSDWGSLFGVAGGDPASVLLSGAIHKPYFVLALLLAGVVAFLGVQTWDYTRRLTVGRALLISCLFVFSVAVLVSTSFHPFIYFIF